MIKCLIADDETLARDLIKSYLKHFELFAVAAEANTAIEAAQILANQSIDLLFLDVNMPQLTGIELLRQLNNKPLTVLCTAHSEYALESYDLDVVDYLLKPIGLARFTKTISKVIDRLEPKQQNNAVKKEPSSNPFFVKSEYKKIKVDPVQIKYIQAMEKYVRIFTKTETIVTLMSMSAIMNYLDDAFFMRVHRSYIINKNFIKAIEGNMIVIDDVRIPVSKANRKLIEKLIRKV